MPSPSISNTNTTLPNPRTFYVNGELKLRLDGKSIEILELEEDTYDFAISSPSFNDCSGFSFCQPVYSSSIFETDTTVLIDTDKQASINLNFIDLLTDKEVVRVSFKIK